jgi:hypothetical protein
VPEAWAKSWTSRRQRDESGGLIGTLEGRQIVLPVFDRLERDRAIKPTGIPVSVNCPSAGRAVRTNRDPGIHSFVVSKHERDAIGSRFPSASAIVPAIRPIFCVTTIGVSRMPSRRQRPTARR